MLRHLDLFSGIGGFSLAAKQLGGIQTTKFVEINPDAQRVLRSNFPSIPIHSDIRDYHQEKENLTSSQWDFPVRERVTQEVNKDSNIQLPHSGEKDLDALLKLNPSSVLWNSLKDLSDEDFELFLADSLWQDTLLRLKQSRRESLGQDIKDSEFLSFPTLTSGQTSTKMRPAGQTKCEKWFRDKGLIRSGYQLGTRAIATLMGFPFNWFEGLTQQYSKNLNIQSQVKPQEESEQDISQVEQLHHHKQPLPSAESSISIQLLGGDKKLLEHKRGEHSTKSQELFIPCLIKQPDRPELKGVIQKDLGDRFVVNVADKSSAVSKLLVYPDFSRSDEPISLSRGERTIPPSTKRRKQGDGAGYIECKPIKRSGKEYKQYWYHWEIWREGVRYLKKSRYIPKRLLAKVEKMEAEKAPVSKILEVLGVKE